MLLVEFKSRHVVFEKKINASACIATSTGCQNTISIATTVPNPQSHRELLFLPRVISPPSATLSFLQPAPVARTKLPPGAPYTSTPSTRALCVTCSSTEPQPWHPDLAQKHGRLSDLARMRGSSSLPWSSLWDLATPYDFLSHAAPPHWRPCRQCEWQYHFSSVLLLVSKLNQASFLVIWNWTKTFNSSWFRSSSRKQTNLQVVCSSRFGTEL